MFLSIIAHVAMIAGASWTALTASGTVRQHQETPRNELIRAVADVQVADYRGDLERLRAGYVTMQRFVRDPDLAIHARYWRGFACWRRALNALGQGGSADSADGDFALAIEEFKEALRIDSSYVEAQIGVLAGLTNRVFFHQSDVARRGAFAREYRPILNELQRTAANNPRFVFVAAAQRFHTPPEWGGSRMEALAMIERAIQSLDDKQDSTANALEPSWGRAELHMLLATLLLRAETELDRAERHAREALRLRPQWRAVRERLIPAISQKRGPQSKVAPAAKEPAGRATAVALTPSRQRY